MRHPPTGFLAPLVRRTPSEERLLYRIMNTQYLLSPFRDVIKQFTNQMNFIASEINYQINIFLTRTFIKKPASFVTKPVIYKSEDISFLLFEFLFPELELLFNFLRRSTPLRFFVLIIRWDLHAAFSHISK